MHTATAHYLYTLVGRRAYQHTYRHLFHQMNTNHDSDNQHHVVLETNNLTVCDDILALDVVLALDMVLALDLKTNGNGKKRGL